MSVMPPVSRVRFVLQGSGQLVGGTPDPGFFRSVADLAEELGYDSIWAGDHVSFHNPIVDVTVALATFAAVTERITIGAGVVLLPLRYPSLVAKELSSLDFLSCGRVVLGIGVGGEGSKDFEAVGVALAECGPRTNQALLAQRELFRGPDARSAGRFFRFESITIEPPPAQPGWPPLWPGGRSAAARRRAGRLGDGWMPIWVSPEHFGEGWQEVVRHATEARRAAAVLVPTVVLPARVEDDGDAARGRLAGHLALRYGTAVAPHHVERHCLAGTPAECTERVAAYVEAGARHVIFNLCCGPADFLGQAERLYGGVVAGVTA